jgi:hypothetical protein
MSRNSYYVMWPFVSKEDYKMERKPRSRGNKTYIILIDNGQGYGYNFTGNYWINFEKGTPRTPFLE